MPDVETLRDLTVEHMGDGAVLEKLNLELARVIENIADINKDDGFKREVQLKIIFVPSADRKQIAIDIKSDAKLAPDKTFPAFAFMADDENGEPKALEPTMRQGDLFGQNHDKNIITMNGGK